MRLLTRVRHEVRLQVTAPHERLAARAVRRRGGAGEGPLPRVHASVHRQVTGRAERLYGNHP